LPYFNTMVQNNGKEQCTLYVVYLQSIQKRIQICKLVEIPYKS
jgi:hypothetical protein